MFVNQGFGVHWWWY